MDPILEGLVTTRDDDGRPHLAPMGPRISADLRRLVLRPFPMSHTFRNLKRSREGVLHVTDDVLLLAKAALGRAELPATFPATHVDGAVLSDCCRYFEFRVTRIDETGERMILEAEVVHAATLRDFWGFNRAKHAVLEAAILMTRRHLLPHEEIVAEFRRFAVIVDKTAGPAEREAFDFLLAQLRAGGPA